MAISAELKRIFRTHRMGDKVKFIESNLHYASASAIVEHVGSYLLDVLEDVDDPELVATYLREHGYTVTQNPENENINQEI